MPENNTPFSLFRAAVLGDPSLELRLRGIGDWEAFTTEAVVAAAERGIELTVDELDAERRQAQLGWLTRWA